MVKITFVQSFIHLLNIKLNQALRSTTRRNNEEISYTYNLKCGSTNGNYIANRKCRSHLSNMI